LKIQVQSFKQLLQSKDEEITTLNQNSKVSKYISLESELNLVKEDHNRLKDQYAILNKSFLEYNKLLNLVKYKKIKKLKKKKIITKH